MPELLRPEPPRSLAERARAALLAVPPARLATAAGTLLLVAAVGWWLVHPQRPPVEASLPLATTVAAGGGEAKPAPAAAAPAAPVPTSAATVVVQVAGAVARPGVYRLATGARVIDLVELAGGPAADADPDQVGLAAVLVDGQRIQVPRRGEQLAPAAVGLGPPPGSTAPAGPVDLNQATADALDGLPGLGPATAQAIVAHREQHGPFGAVDDLLEVRGIGPAKLEALRGLVTV